MKRYSRSVEKKNLQWANIYQYHGNQQDVLFEQASKKYNFDESAMNSSWYLTIAHLSDFHYDPYYAAGSSSDCKEGICCRTESTVGSNLLKKEKRKHIELNSSSFYSFVTQQQFVAMDNDY